MQPRVHSFSLTREILIDFVLGNYSFDSLALPLTFSFLAEMIKGNRYTGKEADIWSVGVILFALLCGYLPFDDDSNPRLYELILNAKYEFPDFLSPGWPWIVLYMDHTFLMNVFMNIFFVSSSLWLQRVKISFRNFCKSIQRSVYHFGKLLTILG